MIDYVTIVSLTGLVLFGVLWKVSPGKAWYYDTDNDPVSMRSIMALFWLICLFVLLMKIFRS